MNTAKVVLFSHRAITLAARRNLGVTSVVASKGDSIQQLFVSKLREYTDKKKKAGGKLVEPSPAFEQQLKEELERVDRVFSVQGAHDDFVKFPTFQFEDETLPPLSVEYKEDLTFDVNIPVVTVKSDPDKAPFEHLV